MVPRHEARLKNAFDWRFCGYVGPSVTPPPSPFQAALPLKPTDGRSTGVMLRRTCAASPLGSAVYRRFLVTDILWLVTVFPHTSLIVPWAAPWCQLLPAPCLHKTRGGGCRKSEQLEEEAAAAAVARGRAEAIMLRKTAGGKQENCFERF